MNQYVTVFRNLTIFLISFFLTTFAINYARSEETKTTDKLVCDKTEQVNKVLEDKGFFLMLKMENKDKVSEYLWIGGTTATITAKVPDTDKTCVLAIMENVVYNADTVEGLYKNMMKQTNRKDI